MGRTRNLTMKCSLALFLLLGLTAMPMVAQKAIITRENGSRPTPLLIDPVALTVTTLATSPGGYTRGHTIGGDGALYYSWRSTSGIGRLDYSTPPGTWTTIVSDPTKSALGAPYNPVVNNEAFGGPGFLVMDSSPAPSSLTTITGLRNMALVSLGGTLTVDGLYPDTFVPMSGFFASPHTAGEFIGVGCTSSDQTISTYTIQGGAVQFSPGIITTLTRPCYYGALIHDDGMLYTWSSDSTFVGFIKTDLTSGTQTLVPVSGIDYRDSKYVTCWNEPWEKPGRIAYVVSWGGMVHRVDLAQAAPAAVSVMRVPCSSSSYCSREVEESQLTSWTTSLTERNFHINFGKAAAGMEYVLVPSLAGLATTPTVIDGQEIWLAMDGYTYLGLLGLLGYQSVGILDSNGEADVNFDLGGNYDLQATWIAAAIENGTFKDISNVGSSYIDDPHPGAEIEVSDEAESTEDLDERKYTIRMRWHGNGHNKMKELSIERVDPLWRLSKRTYGGCMINASHSLSERLEKIPTYKATFDPKSCQNKRGKRGATVTAFDGSDMLLKENRVINWQVPDTVKGGPTWFVEPANYRADGGGPGQNFVKLEGKFTGTVTVKAVGRTANGITVRIKTRIRVKKD